MRNGAACLLASCALGMAAAPCPGHAAMVEVKIVHFAFQPARVPVHPGDTLVITNQDLVPHTATARDGTWTTPELTHGASARVTLPHDAGADFFCAFHPEMTGQLLWQPPN